MNERQQENQQKEAKCPKISILMGIYNCEKTLAAAIDSMLAQTYTNWELILCDDGSADGTYALAERYRQAYPEKIILLRHAQNQGLNRTLNDCLAAATGEYIARQDADDRSLPERFEKELAYLNAHPDCALVGTGMRVFSDENTCVGQRVPSLVRPTKQDIVRGANFCHATILIRKSVMDAVHGYSEDRRLLRLEDYDLWSKIYAAGFYGENMQECLYDVLEDDAAYHRRKFKYRLNNVYAVKVVIRRLELPPVYYRYAVTPILKGLVPEPLYRWLHRRRLSKT